MAAADGGELADKRIQVRVATFDGQDYTYSAWQAHTINERHTVQEAVRQVYHGFPKYCRRVEVRRAGAGVGQDVYTRTEAGERRWAGNLYNMVMQNDEVEIMLFQRKPGGPRPNWQWKEVPGEYDCDEAAGAHRPGGPQHARLVGVAGLLRRMQDLTRTIKEKQET